MPSIPDPPPATVKSAEPTSSPRISFSADFLDEADFISINPHDRDKEKEKEKTRNGEFEFLSSNVAAPTTMLTADELFFEGKLLPFRQKQISDKLMKINVKSEDNVKGEDVKLEENNRMSWFIDEDPSPRPPKCTVLWKELLRLKKHRASSSLSPSSSTSSTTSSSSLSSNDDDSSKKEKQAAKRVKKGLERTRSAGIKLRPMVNLPVCTQGIRSNSLPPLYSVRKGMLDR